MVFGCKKCKKVFRKDMTEYDETDEYCPHCDNHYVISAMIPEASLGIEGEDARIDSRLIKDDREQQNPDRSIFNQDHSSRMG
jgi:hypothetical protein